MKLFLTISRETSREDPYEDAEPILATADPRVVAAARRAIDEILGPGHTTASVDRVTASVDGATQARGCQ